MGGKVLEMGRKVTFSKNLRKVLRQGQNIPVDFINLLKCLTAHRIRPSKLAFRFLTPTAGGRQSLTRIEGIRRHRGCAELRR
jgi:hypothetical protein